MSFWYDLSLATVLPECIRDALDSAATLGELEVHLFTYQSFENIPPRVIVEDANEILPHDEFQVALARTKNIALLADAVRMRAVQRYSSRAVV